MTVQAAPAATPADTDTVARSQSGTDARVLDGEPVPVRLQCVKAGGAGVLLDVVSMLPTPVASPSARNDRDGRAIMAGLPGGLIDGQPPAGAQPVSSGGRQAAWYVSGRFGDAVLRQYRRGGLVARLVRQTYLWQGADNTRGFAELRVMAALHARGLPVPRPLAAAYRRKAGLFYEAAILTQRIPDVRTLAQVLTHASRAADATPQGEGVPARVAAAIVAMHDAGVWHADLNAHNILLDAAGQVWLIDFDRARDHGTPLAPALRVANMQRLRRSLEKVAGAAGVALWRESDRAYAGLNQAYADSLAPS